MSFKKTCILLLLALLSVGELLAQPLFTRVFGGDSYDFGAEVIQLADSSYMIAGTTGSYGLESGQVTLIKTDTSGYVEWQKTYGGQYADRAESMVESSDGNLLIAGTTETTDKSYQFYALKLTYDGDTIWTRKYGGNDWDFCKQATALSDGGFALFGQSYTSGNANFKLVRINSHGDTLWTKSYGGAGFESGESIDTAADGGFYLAGITESFGAGAADMYVVKTDDVGDTLWTKTFGDVEDDFCYGVGATSDTGYVLVGATFNNTADQSDFIIRKEGGSSQWIKHEATPGGSTVTDVLIEPGTGDVTVVGYVQAGDFGKEDGRIVRYGGLDGIWGGMAKSHGSQENDRFYDVKLCSDGGYVMVGTTAGYLNRFDDVYLVRGDEFGLTVNPELGVDEIEIDGKNFSVAIGPNPITENSALLIQDYVGLIRQVEDDLHVSIYNSIGVEIQRIEVNSEKANLNLGAVESGIYFYQLSTGNKVLATGKTIKID